MAINERSLDDRELTIEFRDPRSLRPNPENYRTHPPEQIADIARSMRDLGQFKNVVVMPEGTILAGHGVVQAAVDMGWEQIAVHVFDGSEAKARLLMVADNELWREAEDDERILASLLKGVQADFGDLAGTGWSEAELDEKLAELAEEEPPEDFPEYDENLDVSGIRMVECPECGHEFAI